MKHFITQDTPVTEEALNVIAHLPTKNLHTIVEDKFFVKLSDRNISVQHFYLHKKAIMK